MNLMDLTLPERKVKPRTRGLTVLIDGGLPLHHFEDVLDSSQEYIDLVKFGWGTALVSPTLHAKIECLERHNVHFFFGGTLFEKFCLQGKVDAYHEYLLRHGCRYIEISNGTIPLTNREKSKHIREFSHDFTVLSEVGFKDTAKSMVLDASAWVEYIQEDLSAGSAYVITESRESGTSGICQKNGELRTDVVDDILDAGISPDNLIFEAPNKTLQTYFIGRIGSSVNLGNVPFSDVIGLETLRLGLRSDTLMMFE